MRFDVRFENDCECEIENVDTIVVMNVKNLISLILEKFKLSY